MEMIGWSELLFSSGKRSRFISCIVNEIHTLLLYECDICNYLSGYSRKWYLSLMAYGRPCLLLSELMLFAFWLWTPEPFTRDRLVQCGEYWIVKSINMTIYSNFSLLVTLISILGHTFLNSAL